MLERPIPKFREPKYEMRLSIYPVSECGEDLQKGEPIEVSSTGADVYELKKEIDSLILSTSCSGECFVEMTITKNGEYFDCDEQWVDVDLVNKAVNYGGIFK